MVLTAAALAAVPVFVYKGLGSRSLGQYLHYFPAYRIGEFIIGICLALLVRHGLRWKFGVGATTLLAGVWFIGLAVLNEHASFVPGAGKSGLPQVAAGLAVLPIVSIWLVAAAGADLDAKKSFLRGSLLVKLGLWSFALYITHLIVLHELEIAIGHTAYRGAGGIALEIGALALVIAVAGVVYEFIERPTERSLPRRLHAPSAASGSVQKP
jgi:peptidoglycan/LPS O-acetylase OafA/YrhL